MSLLDELPVAPPDPAFSLVAAFKDDTCEGKVDLCPGFYRDENARPWILPAVRQAKERLHAKTGDHEYLPLAGLPSLLRSSQRLLFGAERDVSRLASLQTVSGTGANYIAAQFLSSRLQPKRVWIPDPTWVNHPEIWKLAGPEVEQRYYPYYDKERHRVDLDGMRNTLQQDARRGDVIILHACAHNPTGADFTTEQWRNVAALCEEIGLFAVFDVAYQGFATGDLVNDVFGITYFYDKLTLEFAVMQSFSKNFGLYGERIGVLHVVARDVSTASKLTPLLTRLSRAEITSCPSYGARLVVEVLEDPALYEQWLKDLRTMSDRIKDMRKDLYDGLQRRNVHGSWDHILTDIGMFSMTGLSPEQVAELREKHHVYLLPSGRLSMAGLTKQNLETVVSAIHDILGSV
ncbi:pyridoxal phosphate-dependent transferase [Microdochium trichocladiopsis]|uniref:Aspartate aminotransferase n=1 Tax=Microdochium trichocladiopsis TaxID=1682393 RepID=A0A9P9BI18_9PEZI|nr:pyridoxal phosphate-dependent transferase [Microdochium trichocladiopsis]KAH7012622.1 pyridoxal phosphate-dependent transferase [Microdochium trichocladiopsis]